MSRTSALVLMAQHLDRAKRMEPSAVYQRNATEAYNGVFSYINTTTPKIGATYDLTSQDKAVLAAHGIIFILALIGNGLVISTLAQQKRMRTVTNTFLLNLSACDLLLAIVCMPFTVIPVMLGDFMFGPVMCSLIRYLQGMSVSASAFTLVAISLERFFAICNPLKSRTWQNLAHSYKVIAAIWAAAMILNIPMAVFQKFVTDPSSGTSQCFDKWPFPKLQMAYYFVHLLIADLLIPFTTMSIAYGLIAKTLWNGFRSMNAAATSSELMVLNSKRQMSLTSDISAESEEGDLVGPNGIIPQERQASINGALLSPTDSEPCRLSFSHSSIPHKTSKRSFSRQETAISLRSHSSQSTIRSKRRVIRMLFVIVIEFFICWTPLYAFSLWILVDRESVLRLPNPTFTLAMLRLLAYFSSCCNPITYCFMSKKFRSAFFMVFRGRKEKQPLKRRPTLLSTQVSYCETSQTSKAKLQLPALNGHNKP
ncbi:cholecystokinin receptor type A-like [Watersipora subatra]|uniref:cholecystokinin receptor type A-like n=1 Tax=Watersipora subatra TaxID=2589382 RepID=UPI00355B564A